MIAVLAGRRIDAERSAQSRFPLEAVSAVSDSIRSLFKRLRISTLVCSAARGADLLALQVAGELGMRRCIVLPGDAAAFRASSVVDGLPGGRQGSYDWGTLFDGICQSVQARGDLLIDTGAAVGEESYLAANIAIFDRAARLASQSAEELVTIIIWNLASRGPDDVTAAFRDEAARRGIPIEEISTL